MSISNDAKSNREAWDKYSDDYQKRHGSQLNRKEFVWGVWSIPESKINALGDVPGKKILELGCGAAQLSVSIHHMGGIPIAIDNSKQQLSHASELLKKNNVSFPLHHCSAEKLPFDQSEFDMVFCDHGAMTFSPTNPTLREVNRVLKTKGTLVFNIQSPLHEMCYDSKNDRIDSSLHQDYFNLGRTDDGDGHIYFQMPYGKWIQAFNNAGFKVLDLIELQAPEDGESTYDYVGKEWARRWPAENIWRLQKVSNLTK